jgi:low affinity Fe/Cu permease
MAHRIPPLERFSELVSEKMGSSWAFIAAVGVVAGWAVSGPLFGFSDTWQLVINTGTTVVTFLMVFLIQRSQNKSTEAMELKLNELIAAMKGASNHLIDIESMSEEELHTLRKHYAKLAEKAEEEGEVRDSHSIAEADERHAQKSV